VGCRNVKREEWDKIVEEEVELCLADLENIDRSKLFTGNEMDIEEKEVACKGFGMLSALLSFLFGLPVCTTD
jgi:hypothetical protein